ncbi:hypothetical protein [Paenibacillus pini]|uniref:Uncharacterized protein n=1 Tax=Paenibacillus pini JCM 16418 TaxID=1236976 RepID=W7YFV2_9BACL|nr:hypothetical protein [Paenibacillus pini]GAF07352.1 hypothetical protein JCM16418_1364 [Paenibacillus pini JCM 16418]
MAIYEEIFERYHERKKTLNPCFQFGTGIQIPTEYSKVYKDILFLMLLEIFYRELRDNPERTDRALKEIAEEIMIKVGVQANTDFIERLAIALLSTGTGQYREAFISSYYNESTSSFEEERFLYLTEDTEAMLRSKSDAQIWKLSESGQKLVFLSLEMADEFGIEIQQLYTLSFIRKGNFQKALGNLDHVKAAVRAKATQERDYAKRMRRDPRSIFSKEREHIERRKSLQEQFQEQKKLFYEMDNILHEKLKEMTDPKVIRDIEYLKEKVDECVGEHSKLTELVVQNYSQEIALQREIERLLNYNRSFVKDIWEKHIYSEGFIFEDGFECILEPFFSPKQEFIYPLSWVWDEHHVGEIDSEVAASAEEPNDIPEIKNAKRVPIDWDSIANLWTPVFKAALEDPQKTCALRECHIGEWTLDALEMWMKFRDGDFELKSSLSPSRKYDDDRAVLLQEVVKRDPGMIEMTNQYKIRVSTDGGEQIQNELVSITPFTLTLIPKEYNGG